MSYDLNDLEAGIGQLRHLLDTIDDHVTEEVDFVDANGNRARGMDLLDALIDIAADMARTIEKSIEDNYRSHRHDVQAERTVMSSAPKDKAAIAAAAFNLEPDICDLLHMTEISMGIATDALGRTNVKPSEREMAQVIFLTTDVYRRMTKLHSDYYAAIEGNGVQA